MLEVSIGREPVGKLCLALTMIVSLTGCVATTKGAWLHSSKSPDQFGSDLGKCEIMAFRDLPRPPVYQSRPVYGGLGGGGASAVSAAGARLDQQAIQGISTMFGVGTPEEQQRQSYIQSCLRMNGWRYVTQ